MTPAEDQLQEAMLAHQDDAPGAAELATVLDRLRSACRPSRRAWPRTAWRRSWRPLLAVAVVLIVTGCVTVVNDRHSGTGPAAVPRPSPALNCPASYGNGKPATQPWVPAPPTVSDSAGRLVPAQAPGHAVVCAFLHGSARPTGSRQLASTELPALAAALAWTPRPPVGVCTADLSSTDGDNYLIGLRYPHGTVWVGVAGDHCSGTTNGAFSSARNLRLLAATLYATGTVPPASQPCAPSTGRLGQEAALVPGQPSSVTVCADPAVAGQPIAITTGLSSLIRALNALPTARFTGTGGIPGPAASYLLTFGYPAGPPVSVQIRSGSTPPIENGSLQAEDPGHTVATLVEQLISRR